MKFVGIAASTRDGSLNRHLFEHIVDRVSGRGHDVQDVNYGMVVDLPHYTAAREASPGIPSEIQALSADILKADGVILASPEYNFSIPGPLKNAIDWVSRIKPSVLIGKPVLLASASSSPVGGWRGLAALRIPLTCLGAQALPWEVTAGGVSSGTEIDERLATEAMSQRVDMAVTAFLDACGQKA
ncbi:NAD(P)H-dependent oxidoreductase [Fluviibacterium sp. DFM31]|uniref:NAD(P)H-dependent oxidoreductase n=1 Tax=Meridianimarinicoccus marinus TaxID=3231483 RepID=A0ABV3LBE9_9RHOB